MLVRGDRLRPFALLVVAPMLAVAGCSGGGGGGTGNSSGTSASTSPALGYVVKPSTAEEVDSENALGPINAFVPIDVYNIRGQNQVVSIFDTGVDASNPDLERQILTTEGYDEGTDTQETISTDPDSSAHGTAVSSIIAGVIGPTAEVEGVAPDAQIVPVELSEDRFGNYNEINDTHLAPAVSYINSLGDVHVINNSWNLSTASGQGLSIQQYEQQYGHTLASDYPSTVAAWQTFVKNGNVVVWAAGNESAAQPDAFAGLPQEVAALQPGWAVAVAITPSGTIASYSNQCGLTAAYCIAAVGGPVSVAVSPAVSSSGYVLSNSANAYEGTSFAAPAVTGAIALLMSASPKITAQQALQILFETANKSGVYAQTAIYGEGVMNLNAAMGPIGETVISAQGVNAAPLAATAMALGGAFGAGPAEALANTPVTVQDSFKRGFVVPLGSHVSPGAPSFDAPDRVALFGRPNLTLTDDGASRFALVEDADPRTASPDSSGLRFVAGQRISAALTLQVAAGVDPAQLLPSGSRGAAADLAQGTLVPGGAANPYFALMSKPLAMAAELKFGATRVAMVSAVGEPILPAGITDQPGAVLPRIVASDIEAEHAFGGAGRIRLDAGTMIESDTLLGTYGTGAAQMSRSETWFAGIGGDAPIAPGTSLVAGLHAGLSSAGGAQGSMVQGAANIASLAAGIGIVGHGWFRDGDKVTLGIGLPLRAVSGRADLLVPTTVNLDGSVTPRTVSVGMNAGGSEADLQGAWTVPVGERTQVTSGLLLRRDPDNIRGAPLETVAAARLDLRF